MEGEELKMGTELIDRFNRVRENIKETAQKAGRNPEDITLIPISKNHSTDKIKYLFDYGIKVFGENRVQELLDKDEKLVDINIKWHFVGHLQRNKVKYLLRMDNCLMIESLDSWRLAKTIYKRAQQNGRQIPVLVEVNVSGDDNKFGIKPENTVEFIKKTSSLSYIDIQGLMTLAPYLDNPEEARPYFQKLANLKAKINEQGYNLKELSMGMTNDYKIAIEEGATIVRVGTGIFGKRDY